MHCHCIYAGEFLSKGPAEDTDNQTKDGQPPASGNAGELAFTMGSLSV